MFSDSLKDGEMGEHAVWNALVKQKWIKSVVDVRDDKNFQEQDIDFWIENTDRQFASVEVKTDYKAHETGNIVYEVQTSNNLGCFEKTKAKYIAYYIPADKVIYLLNTVNLRTYIHQLRPEEREMGDSARGFLIPIDDLKRAGNVIARVFEGVV